METRSEEGELSVHTHSMTRELALVQQHPVVIIQENTFYSKRTHSIVREHIL